MGARISLPDHGGLPMTIWGGDLHEVLWQSEVASAQVKSAILLAALTGGVGAEVIEPQPTRDHTERMLMARGAPLVTQDKSVRLEELAYVEPLDVEVPGDPSSAAFFAGLAAMADGGSLRLERVCVNETRIGFLEQLELMGASVTQVDARLEGGEPVADVVVQLIVDMLPAGGRGHKKRVGVEARVRRSLGGLGLGPTLLEFLVQKILVAGLEHVRAPLQEQHAEDVFLELGGIHLTAQNVRGGEQVTLELGKRQRHRVQSSSANCRDLIPCATRYAVRGQPRGEGLAGAHDPDLRPPSRDAASPYSSRKASMTGASASHGVRMALTGQDHPRLGGPLALDGTG